MKHLNAFLLLIFVVTNSFSIHASDYNGTDQDPNPYVIETRIDTGEFFVENNGLKIWYKVAGNGPVCILPSPGWGPGSDLYYKSMGELEELFTMVYVDTRGTGHSDRSEKEQYTTSNLLSDLEAVRKDIRADHTWLMGHSKGGALVLNYAFQYKDNVDGVILIDASGGINTPQEEMQNAIVQKQDEPWFASAAEYFSREARDEEDWITGIKAVMPFYFSTTENFEKNKEILMQISLSYDAFKGQDNWYDCENELGSILKDISVPVLIVVGMNDFICGPYVSKYLHRELSFSKLLPIDDAGHFPWMEQPEVFFNEIREFIPKMTYPDPDL